ncbi:hypothetical protein ASE06_08550 [Sphingopyxis sp. Root214]|nr:hypothetical protein ASD73_06195 [Sphingopyxis sp. Root154]KRC06703.1 hypothetical protein ASE06_08550 [Sphingopyxis sp. Root214]
MVHQLLALTAADKIHGLVTSSPFDKADRPGNKSALLDRGTAKIVDQFRLPIASCKLGKQVEIGVNAGCSTSIRGKKFRIPGDDIAALAKFNILMSRQYALQGGPRII